MFLENGDQLVLMERMENRATLVTRENPVQRDHRVLSVCQVRGGHLEQPEPRVTMALQEVKEDPESLEKMVI